MGSGRYVAGPDRHPPSSALKPADSTRLVQRPIQRAVALLLGTLVVGVLGYRWIEGWSWLDATWMVIITLTTIGFGEIHPLSVHGRVFTLGLIVAGVGTGAYAVGQITQLFVEGALTDALRARRRQREMDQLKGHYIIVGAGRLGETVAEELKGSGVPFCIIEKEGGAVHELEERWGCPVIAGDGANDDVLRAAGVERAVGMAVAVSNPAESVFVTLSARTLNPKLNIVTRVSDANIATKAKKAGATSVVSPHIMGGWKMAHGLIRPHASSFIDLATMASYEEIHLEEYVVRPSSSLAGRTLGVLKVGEQFRVLVVAIRRVNGKLVPTPSASEKVEAGDVLIVIGAPAAVQRFGTLL